ncbi:hypothetical protein B0H13DRAFT_2471030, partial [Mycena leptocephala]
MYLARGRVRSTILFPLHEIVSANAARHTCGIAGLEAAKKLPPACCTEAYSTSATERLARMRTPLADAVAAFLKAQGTTNKGHFNASGRGRHDGGLAPPCPCTGQPALQTDTHRVETEAEAVHILTPDIFTMSGAHLHISHSFVHHSPIAPPIHWSLPGPLILGLRLRPMVNVNVLALPPLSRVHPLIPDWVWDFLDHLAHPRLLLLLTERIKVYVQAPPSRSLRLLPPCSHRFLLAEKEGGNTFAYTDSGSTWHAMSILGDVAPHSESTSVRRPAPAAEGQHLEHWRAQVLRASMANLYAKALSMNGRAAETHPHPSAPWSYNVDSTPPPAAGASATRPTWCTVHACGARPLPLLILRAPLAPTVRLRTRREPTSLSVPHRAPPRCALYLQMEVSAWYEKGAERGSQDDSSSTGRVPPASTGSKLVASTTPGSSASAPGSVKVQQHASLSFLISPSLSPLLFGPVWLLGRRRNSL